jgi:DNA-directed RNA polymerase specialized sigma24 family protein
MADPLALISAVVGIAAHKVIDRYRDQRRDARLDDECDQPLDDNGFTKLIDELSVSAVLRAVRELIDRQPARRRAVATLYFLEEGVSVRNVPPGAIDGIRAVQHGNC